MIEILPQSSMVSLVPGDVLEVHITIKYQSPAAYKQPIRIYPYWPVTSSIGIVGNIVNWLLPGLSTTYKSSETIYEQTDVDLPAAPIETTKEVIAYFTVQDGSKTNGLDNGNYGILVTVKDSNPFGILTELLNSKLLATNDNVFSVSGSSSGSGDLFSGLFEQMMPIMMVMMMFGMMPQMMQGFMQPSQVQLGGQQPEVRIPRPQPPRALSPGTGVAPGPTLTPTVLRWTVSKNAEYYQLYVTVSPYGSNSIIHMSDQITATSYTLPDDVLEPNKSYQWYVEAINSAGSSIPSNKLHFKTKE